jgi:hypothetical protein
MVAHVDAFNGPRGGHSTNQDSHVRLVSTIVTMPVQTKALYTVMTTFRPANPSRSKVAAEWLFDAVQLPASGLHNG